MRPRPLIYGANGYTGEMIARAACARGLAPLLAGRSRDAVAALAGELGCDHRIFDLSDPARLAAGLADCRVVIHCAGPFSATAAPMMAACIAARVHYTDITGEIDVFEHAFRQDAVARAAGVLICPGTGFDVVPTDCIALTLARALPDASRLALGFDSRSGLSRGTAATSVEGLGNGSCVREDGTLRRIPLGSRARRIDFGAGEKLATAIPWGDVSTAYRTTGIPNIEVFIPVSPKALANLRRLGRLGWLLRRRAVQSFLKSRIAKREPGPDASAREKDASARLGRGDQRQRPRDFGANSRPERLHGHEGRRGRNRRATAGGRCPRRVHDSRAPDGKRFRDEAARGVAGQPWMT